MFGWIKRLGDRLATVIYVLLLIDLCHQASHMPFRCSDDCPWPWGKNKGYTIGVLLGIPIGASQRKKPVDGAV